MKTLKVLSAVNTKDELNKYLHDTWKFQVSKGLQHGNYPDLKPSNIYTQLFETMPFSGNVKQLLREMDEDFSQIHSKSFSFTFLYRGGKFSTTITDVKDYDSAFKKAATQLMHKSNFGIYTFPLLKYLIRQQELIMTVKSN